MTSLAATSELSELIDHQGEKSISLIMPTHASGRQVTQNAIRFKNLVSQATEKLVALGESESEANKRVQLLLELQRDDDFWQHQRAGLAVYLSNDGLTAVGLLSPPSEVTLISECFYVTPIALDAAGQKRFRVLTLTWDEAQVYLANRTDMNVDETDLFPIALRDVILPPDAEDQLQFRTPASAAGGVMYHGQGGGEGMIESDRKRFLSEVGKRCKSLGGQSPLPLIIVGTEEVRGEFIATTQIEPSQTIDASPDGLGPQEVADRVSQLINDVGEQDSAKELGDQLGTALAQSRGSLDAEEILTATSAGRVRQLLLSSSLASQASKFDEETLLLVNTAVIQTLQAGGEIVECSDKVLGSSSMGAIYRY